MPIHVPVLRITNRRSSTGAPYFVGLSFTPRLRPRSSFNSGKRRAVRNEKVAYLCKSGATNTDDKYALSICYHGYPEEVVVTLCKWSIILFHLLIEENSITAHSSLICRSRNLVVRHLRTFSIVRLQIAIPKGRRSLLIRAKFRITRCYIRDLLPGVLALRRPWLAPLENRSDFFWLISSTISAFFRFGAMSSLPTIVCKKRFGFDSFSKCSSSLLARKSR